MTKTQIDQILLEQRRFFRTKTPFPVRFRLQALYRLKNTILKYEPEINGALKKDLGKSACESYLCETGMVLHEISYMLKHLPEFAKETTVWTPAAQFPARSYQKPAPYGTVLVISPWNYPFLLAIGPLVDAIAAGNTAVVKPSAYSAHTSRVIQKILQECFPSKYVCVVTGGRAENECLLLGHFDYIFFTGSQAVGKEVMKKAALHLTPVTLELGGKSPCIVEKSADLKLAARRIVFGKFLNCGQTCVAPDYIYCDRRVKGRLVKELKHQIRRQYGKNPLDNPDYGKIINEKHFNRLCGLIDPKKVVFGGRAGQGSMQIEPTLLDEVTFADAAMQEEIFGPLLPILTYDTLDEAIRNINFLPHPLALYIFTSDKTAARKTIARCGFGGGCINDTIIHLASTELGFGGFGESGMGAYHGKAGFDTFSHYKSIVDKKTWLDLPMRYQPYKQVSDFLIRRFLR